MHSHWLRQFRLRLADTNSLAHMSALGVLSGLSCGLVILAFRFAIDGPSSLWMPDGLSDNFEALPAWLRFALPLGGALLLGLVMSAMQPVNTRVGIAHVLTRLHAGYGLLPLKNALLQFFGGAFAIITGQSGGREGPAIHLGAAASSQLGQGLKLPNNSIRLMVGCGTAAAIAASFNTPIAGVIFAMEVVMLEYTVAGFIPIMLSAITGTILTRAVYGTSSLFLIPTIKMASLWEVPYIVVLGLVAGCFAALFQVILKLGLRFSEQPVILRCAAAGAITGCIALLVPEVMGIGYDSLNAALADQLPLLLLFTLIAAKIVATALSTGLGLPVGLIGPNLLIGACIGSAMGTIGRIFFPELASNHSFYVLLGMGAMMGAVLNAPLAALMALIELGNNTAMIFPGMLAITVATLTTSEVFKQQSAHRTTLSHLKLLIPTDPVSLALQRTSVASLLKRDVQVINSVIDRQQAAELLDQPPLWYVVRDEASGEKHLVWGNDLNPPLQLLLEGSDDRPIEPLAVAGKYQQVMQVPLQATLCEALSVMDTKEVDVVYVTGDIAGPFSDHGIITRADIEKHSRTSSAF